MTDRVFKRSFDSIRDIADFTSEVFRREQIDLRILSAVDLALEELFTNVVKYSRTTEATVRIDVARIPGGVEVTLTDFGVDRFDVTQAPEVDVTVPIEQRKPGGLGLHLIRQMVDALDYHYDEKSRQGKTTFRKTIADRRRRPRTGGEVLAIDFGADGVVVIVGRLDAAQCAAAQSFLDRVEGPVTLDCSRLEYISSAGLGVVVQVYKRLNAAGQALRIVNLRPKVRNVFTYAGLHRLLQIE